MLAPYQPHAKSASNAYVTHLVPNPNVYKTTSPRQTYRLFASNVLLRNPPHSSATQLNSMLNCSSRCGQLSSAPGAGFLQFRSLLLANATPFSAPLNQPLRSFRVRRSDRVRPDRIGAKRFGSPSVRRTRFCWSPLGRCLLVIISVAVAGGKPLVHRDLWPKKLHMHRHICRRIESYCTRRVVVISSWRRPPYVWHMFRAGRPLVLGAARGIESHF